MTAALLEVAGLSTSFPQGKRRVPIVDGIDFRIDEGEVLALVGESGCGKSLTALSLMRLVPRPGRVTGRVALEGRSLLDLPITAMRRIRGARMSMIFQEPMTSLNPVQRVGDQVVEAIQLHEDVDNERARAKALALFEQVRIPDPEARLSVYPHQMSGGMKQRVMIAMALSTRPKLLIADEPTTALDVTVQAQILELLRELQRQLRMAILLITHDLGVVNELADRVAVMYGGRIVERGTRHEVLASPRHPYTEGLLNAMPSRVARGTRLQEIEGVVPSPASWPTGCRFFTRCARVLQHCESDNPLARHFSASHQACCHALSPQDSMPDPSASNPGASVQP